MPLVDLKRWEVIGQAVDPETGEIGTLVCSRKTGLYCIVHAYGFRIVNQTWAEQTHQELVALTKGN